MEKEKEISPLADLIRSRFPGKKFLMADLRAAGRKLGKGDAEDAALFLEGRQRDSVPNLRPPAFCNIVGKSRPVEEWPVYRLSMAVQKAVFSLTADEFRDRCGRLPGFPSRKEDIWSWVAGLGLDKDLYEDGLGDLKVKVQALNLIIRSAAATYSGAVKKVENRNKKRAEKAAAKNKSRAERGLPPLPPQEAESPFGEDGRLKSPPGPNRVVLCYQSVSPRPVRSAEGLPPEYRLYAPGTKDVGLRREDRLSIPEGEPGHVPEWQRREGLVKDERGRRRRRWYSHTNLRRNRSLSPEKAEMARLCRAEESMLMETRIGDDWVAYDVRGLLRNARWRGLALEEDMGTEDLMGLFSGDPVIDPARGIVTFLYKEGVIDASSSEVVPARFAPKALSRACSSSPVALISVDLGQTNLVAARATELSLVSGEVVAGRSLLVPLDEDVAKSVLSVRSSLDELEDSIVAAAKGSLPPDYAAEVLAMDSDTPARAAARLCAELGVDAGAVPWEDMGPGTEHVSSLLRSLGREGEAEIDGVPLKDRFFARRAKARVGPEARAALNEAVWALKSESAEYRRLSKRKKEAVRRAVNQVMRDAKRALGVRQAVLNVEDLNVSSGFFSGRGKTDPGWEGLLSRKRENRWLIKDFHGAIYDLAKNRGVLVVESPPKRTSMTCTECGHCDAGNRSGERFSCLRCGHLANADFDVATRNLERVALSGRPMPRPPEGPGGETETGAARKAGTRAGSGQASGVRSTGEAARNRSQRVDKKAS